jgi:hypothetical protein
MTFATFSGDDDYFSSDSSQERRQKVFGQIKVPVAVFLSRDDEYLPPQVSPQELAHMYSDIPCVTKVVVLGKACPSDTLVDHALSMPGAQAEFFDHLLSFVRDCLLNAN